MSKRYTDEEMEEVGRIEWCYDILNDEPFNEIALSFARPLARELERQLVKDCELCWQQTDLRQEYVDAMRTGYLESLAHLREVFAIPEEE